MNVASVALFLALIFRHSFGKNLVRLIGKHALILGFLVSLSAVLGSLFYSNVVGFEPCLLCWYQRIAIYPMLILFGVALLKKDRGVFSYILPLNLVALILSAYHSYVQWGGNPLIPCDATASCTKLYVYEFGYVTIPTMTLSVVATFLLLYWANRIYENSHTR